MSNSFNNQANIVISIIIIDNAKANNTAVEKKVILGKITASIVTSNVKARAFPIISVRDIIGLPPQMFQKRILSTLKKLKKTASRDFL